MNNVTGMMKLAVSCVEKDAHMGWRQLIAKSMDCKLDHLGWNGFKSEIEIVFSDVDRELKLRQQLSAIRQTTSVTACTKEFHKIAFELGEQVLDDWELMFMYVEGLKPAVKMQVLLARPDMLVEAELLAERANMAILHLDSDLMMAIPDITLDEITSNQEPSIHRVYFKDQY